MMKIVHAFLVTVSTAIVLIAITSESVSAKTYYVTPSKSNNYSAEKSFPCFTLSQYATKEDHFFASNTTLILLSGNHSLDWDFSVKNILFLAISAENASHSDTFIDCGQNARLRFGNIGVVTMRGLVLTGCTNNNINLVTQFTLEDCILQGCIRNGTGLGLTNVTSANIVRSSFSSFTGRKIDGTQKIVFGGGALNIISSTITVNSCKFTGNAITSIHTGVGAALYATLCTITINNTTFDSNAIYVIENGQGGALYTSHGNLTIHNSTFTNNAVIAMQGYAFGGAVSVVSGLDNVVASKISISVSTFKNNIAAGCNNGRGGAVHTYLSTISLMNSTFENNTASGYVEYAGVVHLFPETDSISKACNNFSSTSTANGKGGALYIASSKLKSSGYLSIQRNIGNTGVLYGVLSQLYFSCNTTISNNQGSLFLYSSNVTFAVQTIIHKNLKTLGDGGGITAFHSVIQFFDETNITNNSAKYGGAISIMESKLLVNGSLHISYNKATKSGGGIYSYQSDVIFKRSAVISFNRANKRGGGIHAISTTTTLTDGSRTFINHNNASEGGGMCLELNSKIYITKAMEERVQNGTEENRSVRLTLHFTGNSATYGGALYIDDYTNSGTCSSEPFSSDSVISGECFIQGLRLDQYSSSELNTLNTYFTNNTAIEAGGVMYGGLLDRCTVSPFAELFNKYPDIAPNSISGTTYLLNITNLAMEDYSSIKLLSSEAVRVCFCRYNKPNCSYQLQPVYVKSGELFNISLVGVDQVNNIVSNSTIVGFVSDNAKVGEGQFVQHTKSSCTSLSYSIRSVSEDKLNLYVRGPCSNKGISKVSVTVKIEPCPVGFKEEDSHCTCDSNISEYIYNCSIHKDSVLRKENVWISYTNETGYLLYSYCPFEYCKRSPVFVNLSATTHSEFHDVQCAFNRSGKLCGRCKDNFSLTLGRLQCKDCSDNSRLWLLLAFALNGIVIVILLLVLNITVPVGTINGLIFYAHIVDADHEIFKLSDKNKLLSVFISCLTMSFRFESCFYDGMDGYAATWLQLVAPAFVMILVIIIIIISKYSTKFAQLLSTRNPVATLATLILISYAKLIRTIYSSLSFAVIRHRNDIHYTSEIVWLVDGNMPYLRGKHIPLFITALVILVVGLVFSFVLFFWQWLLHFPNRRPFKWIRNTKLNSFMDAYCAPYTPRHRYWTGLLLFARLLLYLVFSLFNVSSDPEVNLFSIIIVVGSLQTYMLFVKVYKKWPLLLLELSFHANLICLSAILLYVRNTTDGDKNGLRAAYASVSIAFITSLAIVFYHVYKYVAILKRCIHKAIETIKVLLPNKPEISSTNYCNDQELNELREPLISTVTVEESPFLHEEGIALNPATCSVVDAPH